MTRKKFPPGIDANVRRAINESRDLLERSGLSLFNEQADFVIRSLREKGLQAERLEPFDDVVVWMPQGWGIPVLENVDARQGAQSREFDDETLARVIASNEYREFLDRSTQ